MGILFTQFPSVERNTLCCVDPRNRGHYAPHVLEKPKPKKASVEEAHTSYMDSVLLNMETEANMY